MKWIFECESERRDYLHDRSTSQRNDFCMINNMHRVELGAMVDRFTQNNTISKQPASRLATRDDHCFRMEIFSQPFH